jgi:hypothetical protein
MRIVMIWSGSTWMVKGAGFLGEKKANKLRQMVHKFAGGAFFLFWFLTTTALSP